MTATPATERACAVCDAAIPAGLRWNARYCTSACRRRAERELARVARTYLRLCACGAMFATTDPDCWFAHDACREAVHEAVAGTLARAVRAGCCTKYYTKGCLE